MADSSTIEISTGLLRKLHRIQQQRADLDAQRRRGPIQLQAVQAKVDKAKADVEAAAAVLKKTRMNSDEKQLQLQSREAHVAELEKRLNTAASNKEFQLLKDQIAADQQANSVQSDEIFEILERIDTLESELQEKKNSHHGEIEEQETKRQQIESRMTQVQSELDRVDAQLAEAEQDIPAAARPDYRRLVQARGEEALAPVDDESCGGCHQTLTTQLLNQVMLSRLVHCPNCNAFMYAAEDRRVR